MVVSQFDNSLNQIFPIIRKVISMISKPKRSHCEKG